MFSGRFKSLFRVLFAVLCSATLALGAPDASRNMPGALPVENPAPRHYEVSVRLDVPLSLGIVLTSVLGVYQYYGMSKISSSDLKPKSELLPWDRPFAGLYSGWATTVSHYSGALAVAPLALAGYSWYKGDADGHDFGAFSLMFVEAFALQNALNQLVAFNAVVAAPLHLCGTGRRSQKGGVRARRGLRFVLFGTCLGCVYGSRVYRGVVL